MMLYFNTKESNSEWIIVVALIFHLYHGYQLYFLFYKFESWVSGEEFQLDGISKQFKCTSLWYPRN